MDYNQPTATKLTPEGFRFLCKVDIREADRILKDMLRSGDREKIAEAFDYYQASENKMLGMACLGSLQLAESLRLSEDEWRISRVLAESQAFLTSDGFSVVGIVYASNLKGPLSLPICNAGHIYAWGSIDLTFPLLDGVDRGINADYSKDLCFPALEWGHGDFSAKKSKGLKFEKLQVLDGDLGLLGSQDFLALKLAQINGEVTVEESTNAHFPELEEISKTLNWRKSHGFSAPKLIKADQVKPGRDKKRATPMLGGQNSGPRGWIETSLEDAAGGLV
jgi:hypothetical protein